MSDADRRALAGRQRELVSALSGSGGVPTGMEAERIDLAARSLRVKRRRGVEKTWPALRDCLGSRFEQLFERYARQHAPPDDGHRADGRRFAEWAAHEAVLDDRSKLQIIAARAAHGWPVRTVRLNEGRRRAVAVRIPGLGVRSFQVPRIG